MFFVGSYSPLGLPKLFTVGCGDEFAALTLPPMNNFGRPIRVRFPSPAPLIIINLQSRAVKMQ
jgi:hypothetical protein